MQSVAAEIRVGQAEGHIRDIGRERDRSTGGLLGVYGADV